MSSNSDGSSGCAIGGVEVSKLEEKEISFNGRGGDTVLTIDSRSKRPCAPFVGVSINAGVTLLKIEVCGAFGVMGGLFAFRCGMGFIAFRCIVIGVTSSLSPSFLFRSLVDGCFDKVIAMVST